MKKAKNRPVEKGHARHLFPDMVPHVETVNGRESIKVEWSEDRGSKWVVSTPYWSLVLHGEVRG